MPATTTQASVDTLEIIKSEFIAAPLEIVFESILEQMGPYNETGDGTAMPMVLEARPGGRWFRDLGNDAGHCWGFVQAIKAPTLLEIQGPLFMSAPAISHVLYRLTPERNGTRVAFSHRAMGLLPDAIRDGLRVGEGWGYLMKRIIQAAEGRAKETK